MRTARGFTLMELLVVLTLVAVLASLVAPVVSSSILRAKEATLKENLFIMRKAIDDYYADQGDYPGSLQQLVEKRYIRRLPVDPLTDRSDSWVEARAEEDGKQGGIIDVRSGSEEKSGDGAAYRDW
jgi:general secretion pathway protein G